MRTQLSTFSVQAFWEMPLVVIMRGFPTETAKSLTRALSQGGLKTIEVTMNTPDAPEQIRQIIEQHEGEDIQIGAGTVTHPKVLERALDAGASFIVTPHWNDAVVAQCQSSKIPFLPGCMTPTEIWSAHEAGALAAKVFPAESLGPKYIQSIKAPLPQVRLAPTGGVTIERMKAYWLAGADAFGIGSPLFPEEAVASGDWSRIEKLARNYVEAYRHMKSLSRGIENPSLS